jgi:hypothetical protein
MNEFDPEEFAEEKYASYFTGLQRAYKSAFETMNDAYDSTLIHAIDQTVLAESEPFYEADEGTFRIELPAEPPAAERVADAGVVVDDERLTAVLDRYREELRAELEREFLSE